MTQLCSTYRPVRGTVLFFLGFQILTAVGLPTRRESSIIVASAWQRCQSHPAGDNGRACA